MGWGNEQPLVQLKRDAAARKRLADENDRLRDRISDLQTEHAKIAESQDRIRECLTAERDAARREAEQARAELAGLRVELERTEGDWAVAIREANRARAALARVAHEATSVMDALAEYGPGIVGHLLDDDDNAGERLRRELAALSVSAPTLAAVSATFDLDSDDPALRSAIESLRGDAVATWRIAVFCAQQQLERALRAEAVREHYESIHRRARATREAKRLTAASPGGESR